MGLQLDRATVIEEGERWTLAVNRNQTLLGGTMVVLRRPCTDVVELDRFEWSVLQPQMQRLVAAVGSLFEPDRFNFAFLMNHEPQVHLHVMPRYATARRWNDEEFVDPDWGRPYGHHPRTLESQTLAALASEIGTALPELT